MVCSQDFRDITGGLRGFQGVCVFQRVPEDLQREYQRGVPLGFEGISAILKCLTGNFRAYSEVLCGFMGV